MADRNQFVIIPIPTTLGSHFCGRQITITHEVVFTLTWNAMFNNRWDLVIPVTVCPSFGQSVGDRASAPDLSSTGADATVYNHTGMFPSIPVAEAVEAEYTAVDTAIPEDWRASHVEIATAVALPSAPEEHLPLYRGSQKALME